MKQEAIAYLCQNESRYRAIAKSIWEHPELSLKEYFACRTYADALEQAGFAVETGVCGIETAVVGRFGSGRPVIGILGEYDALSGLSQCAGALEPKPLVPGGAGHGCGHHLLGAGSFAAACAVKEMMQRHSLPGTVIFFGCPGEEGGAAKAYMARERYWEKLDAAITWHPSTVNEVATGTCNSSIQVLYEFQGIAAHAAGNPHQGRSALDGVELMNVGAQFLREHITPDCRLHYAIIDSGGVSPNVVQPSASVLYMVRGSRVRDTVALLARVDDLARGAALMTGTSFHRTFIDGTAETVPNFTLEERMQKNLEYVGAPKFDAEDFAFAAALKATYSSEGVPGVGAEFDESIREQVRALTDDGSKPLADFICPAYHGTGFQPGSTDVGDVSWLTPTVQVHTACNPIGAPGHSWQNVSCGCTEIAYKGMLTAAEAMACTALELLQSPETLAQATEEFHRRTREGYLCPIEPDAVPIAI